MIIDTGRFSGGNRIFADPFEVSVELEVLDDHGSNVNAIKTSDNTVKGLIYKVLTCPNSSKCDWKEIVIIELNRDWTNLHLKFSIFKHSDKGSRKLYGFSFMKISRDDKLTFIKSGFQNLNVFQVHKNQAGNIEVEDYLQKDFVYDKSRANSKSLGSGKYSYLANDCFTVRTLLQSCRITDDENISKILELGKEHIKEEAEIAKVLEDYLNSPDLKDSKKILFMNEILQVLIKLINAFPSLNKNIFRAIVQTIHPIITNKTDFGYVSLHLDRFLENVFNKKGTFNFFVDEFNNFVTEMENSEFNMFALMAMKLIFKFVITSFLIDVDLGKPDDMKNKILGLLQALGEKFNGNDLKDCRGRAFKAFFDVENLENLIIVIDAKTLLNILKICHQSMIADKDVSKYTIMVEILQSKLWEKEPEMLVHIASDLILQAAPHSNTTTLILTDVQKKSLRPLIQSLYEKVKKSKQETLINYILQKIFPFIVKLVSAQPQQKDDVEDVVLFSFLADMNKETLEYFLNDSAFAALIEKVFIFIQKKFVDSDTCFLTDVLREERLKLYSRLANFFKLVVCEDFLKFGDSVINNCFAAMSAIVCNHDLNHDMVGDLSSKVCDNRQDFCKTLERLVGLLFPNQLLDILTNDFERMMIMESLFQISIEVYGAVQKTVFRSQS